MHRKTGNFLQLGVSEPGSDIICIHLNLVVVSLHPFSWNITYDSRAN